MKKLVMVLIVVFGFLGIYVYNGVFENPYDFRTHDTSPYYLQMINKKEYDACRDEVVESAQKACYGQIELINGMYYRHDYTYGSCVLRYLAEICQVNSVSVEK